MDLALKSNNFIFYSRQISYVPSFDIWAIKSTLIKVKLDEKVKVHSFFLLIRTLIIRVMLPLLVAFARYSASYKHC